MANIVYVNYGDEFHYYTDLVPDPLMPKLFEVTDEEYIELVRLQKEFNKFQALLKDISHRTELESNFDTDEFVPAQKY